MGFFDAIKDALTVDDQERYDAAVKKLEQARANADKVNASYDASQRDKDEAQKVVDAAQAEVNQWAAKAGVAVPDAPVETPADPVADTVAALNSIKNPDLIFPGQVFKIPN